MSDAISLFNIWASMVANGDRVADTINGYYSTEALALEAGKGKSWYGSNGTATRHVGIRVNGEVYVLSNNGYPVDLDRNKAKADEELRQALLAKLSTEEKRVLGLK